MVPSGLISRKERRRDGLPRVGRVLGELAAFARVKDGARVAVASEIREEGRLAPRGVAVATVKALAAVNE